MPKHFFSLFSAFFRALLPSVLPTSDLTKTLFYHFPFFLTPKELFNQASPDIVCRSLSSQDKFGRFADMQNSPRMYSAGNWNRQKNSFLTGQPFFASRPSDSRAAKNTEKSPVWGDPFHRVNRRSRKNGLRAAALNNPRDFFDRQNSLRVYSAGNFVFCVFFICRGQG